MYEKMTLEQYAEILASRTSTPGGGSALAVVGSVACALVEMSINVTVGKLPENDNDSAQLQGCIAFFTRARKHLLSLADLDAEAFRHILDCKHLPDETDDQRKHKTDETQKAYHKAALIPLDLMRLCKEALDAAQNKVFPYLYKYVASDCKIGMDLFRNIVENSMENVYANTTLIADTALRTMLENQGKDILQSIKAR